MKNQIQEGNTLTFLAPYDVASGGGFMVGDIFAVAAYTAKEDEEVEGVMVGVFALNKKAGDAVSDQGVKLYWDDTNKEVTITESTNKFIGHSAATAVGGDATVDVRLVPN